MSSERNGIVRYLMHRRHVNIMMRRGMNPDASPERAAAKKSIGSDFKIEWKLDYDDDDDDEYVEKYPDVPRDGRPNGFLNLFVSTGQTEPFVVLDMNDEEQAADFQTFLGENADLSNQADGRRKFHNLLCPRFLL